MRKFRQPKLWRRCTGRWRVLPGLLIVGTQRGGTSSLNRYLRQHPCVVGACWKEVHFFDDRDGNYGRGLNWYRSHFPTRREFARLERADGRKRFAFEATPNYMYKPEAAARMAHDVPNARLVVLIRNPIDRALSAHKNITSKGRISESFQSMAERELGWIEGGGEMPKPLLRRGLYAEQLERLFEHFPREQVLVMTSEEMYVSPQSACKAVFDFVGLDPHPIEVGTAYNRSKDRAKMDAALRDRLNAFFAPHNARLEELLARELGWKD
ncbi:MAG: sulfotransferase domain-containing protein [bacterium]|nr:sulfotransferase domain-containing protein [bacterium]